MSSSASITRTPRKAALASFMGSAVEYYDFFVFGSAAALIFPQVFFPSWRCPALVLSFATFGVAYIARPSARSVLGHFGDRIGRQKVLMFTLVLMGLLDLRDRLPADVRPIGWWRARPARAVPTAARPFGRRRAGGRQFADPGALSRPPTDASSRPGR